MSNNELSNFVRESMHKDELRFTKSLGQNFLIDQSVLFDIIEYSELTKEDNVLEIGAGIGVLTRELAKVSNNVVAVEIDKHIIETLQKNVSGFENVNIINKDILKMDFGAISHDYFNGENFKIVANLPYYITTPIIMGLLESKCCNQSMVFMVQKEVAQRMIAVKGKAYGALSVAVQYYGEPSIKRIVSSSCFVPHPKVDSAVIKIDIYNGCPINIISSDIFFKVVRAAFNQRRKTIVNSLLGSPLIKGDKNLIIDVLGKAKIPTNARPESLSLVNFADISNALCNFN